MTRLVPSAALAVFVETNTTGRHPGTDVIGLHEAILARQRVERSGESLIIEKAWPEHIERVLPRNLSEEYPRLVKKYGKPDVVAIYGEPHTGRLKSVMDRIHTAFAKGMDVSKIIELGRPDSDYMDISDGIEVPAGMQFNGKAPKPAETIEDDDSHKPSLSAVLSEEETDTAPVTTKKGKKPTPPQGIDELAEATEEPVLDGKLVDYLKDLGWNEPDSMAIARLVMVHGIRQLPDEPLKALRSFGNAAARKKIRNNLASYDPKAVAASP